MKPLLESLAASGLPIVRMLHTYQPVPPWPAAEIDWEAVGRMGAQHLLELGAPNFAFYRFFVDAPDTNDSQRGFIQELEAHGHSVHQLDFGSRYLDPQRRTVPVSQRVTWLQAQIRKLPLPLAIMTEDDRYTIELVLAARGLGLRVPEDIAILGAEDQSMHNYVSDQVSSIDVNFQEVGQVACQMLDHMLKGEAPGSPKVPFLVKVRPKGVIVRQSTVTFTCDHPGVTAAAIFVRQHFQEHISVGDVAAHAGMSVRSLQADYPSRVGCTVKADILKARLKRAQFLLERTDLKLGSVASESGFIKPEYLCRVFQRECQMTPHAWRQKSRQE